MPPMKDLSGNRQIPPQCRVVGQRSARVVATTTRAGIAGRFRPPHRKDSLVYFCGAFLFKVLNCEMLEQMWILSRIIPMTYSDSLVCMGSPIRATHVLMHFAI